jgi:ceramide glucosyltransferase
MLAQILLAVAVLGTLSSTVFLVLVLRAARRFRRQALRRRDAVARWGTLPPVSVIKPLHGLEPRLEQNLESFFRQDYPDFELLFAARTPEDPAFGVVEALCRRYPQVKVRKVYSGEPPWPNPRVYSEEKMLAVAAHEIVVIGDSDVLVPPEYLRNIVAPLCDPAVGLVTCIYRGLPSGGLWSEMEALGFSVELTSGVLVADMLEGMKFALGPTTATRKECLEKIGGIRVLADYHSDDYEIGRRIHAAGYKVVLSHLVIDHVTLNTSMFSRQVRWMKSTRFSRPKGHVGSGLTFAMPFALLGLGAGAATGHWPLALGLLFWGIANRVVQALGVGWFLMRDPLVRRRWWLYPLRDLLGFLFWSASFAGSSFYWRGERYRFGPGGRLLSERSRRMASSSPGSSG